MNRRAKLRIGNALTKGPWTLHVPDRVGWKYVESQHSLHWHDPQGLTWRSVRLYCDACGDDEEGYLDPIARLARWDRLDDLQAAPEGWPDVRIERFRLPLDCPTVQAEVRRQQEAVQALRFRTLGLPTRRDFGEHGPWEAGRFEIRTGGGWDDLKWRGDLGTDSPLADALDRLAAIVRDAGDPLPPTAFVECYDTSFEALADGRRWDWNGIPTPPE
ncbi:hypothetical protein [Alienimonas sp. DA493]|uniref:hypothetical protein n=1 Tax=Alienimonas sp. DA493 TaxID=3373605 RepID=UPI003754D6A0